MTDSRNRGSLSFWPREHGAYAQLAFPLLTALALGDLGLAPILLVVAIIAVFLAHEPLIVLIGGRGGRARREFATVARLRVATLLGLAVLSGAGGWWLAGPTARAWSLLPLGLALLLAPLTLTRREKTLAGELLVASALSATLVPVAVAGGLGASIALIACAVWAVIFSLGTITVRAIIARAKKSGGPSWNPYFAPLLCAVAMAIAIAIAIGTDLPALAAAAVVPTALVALIFGVLGVHPRNLRRMGWSLVASNLAVLAALLIGLG
jgi:hypothetical protein